MRNADFQFTERDLEIVHDVHELRIATLDHLCALTNRSRKALERRLPKLCGEKFLRRLKPQPHKGLYVLGPQAAPALIEAGFAPTEFSEKRLRENEWKDLTIPHALLVASIRVKLIILSRSEPIRITTWEPDQPKLWDDVQTPNDGRLPVRPDAHFAIEDSRRPGGKNVTHFFLEADVGTMSHTKILLKTKAYAAYHEQRRHTAKYGIHSFQVAIITETRARAANLRAEIYPSMSAAQRRAYLFIPLGDLTLGTLFPASARPAAA